MHNLQFNSRIATTYSSNSTISTNYSFHSKTDYYYCSVLRWNSSMSIFPIYLLLDNTTYIIALIIIHNYGFHSHQHKLCFIFEKKSINFSAKTLRNKSPSNTVQFKRSWKLYGPFYYYDFIILIFENVCFLPSLFFCSLPRTYRQTTTVHLK